MATITSPTPARRWKPKTCSPSNPVQVDSDFDQIIRRIQSKNSAGIRQLHAKLSGGIRFFLSRSLGTHDVGRVLEATFLIIVEAILNGNVSGHDALFDLIEDVIDNRNFFDRRTGTARGAAPMLIRARNAFPGDHSAADPGTLELVRLVLIGTTKMEREALARYYVLGRDEEQILAETGLPRDQWRALRSQVRDRFIALKESRFLPRKPVRSAGSRARAAAIG